MSGILKIFTDQSLKKILKKDLRVDAILIHLMMTLNFSASSRISSCTRLLQRTAVVNQASAQAPVMALRASILASARSAY